MPASGSNGPAGPSRQSRTPRRCAKRSSGRSNSGSGMAMRRHSKWPSVRALPARRRGDRGRRRAAVADRPLGLAMSAIYDVKANSLLGEEVPMKRFEGQVLLIVNTASKCGFTPQYRGLEDLHRDLNPRGFSVLGFPCNQFGAQEPGDARQIEAFCETKFHVTFPMFAKIDVNGSHAHPLFNHLKNEKSGLLGSSIKWNFTKFLVDRSGKVVGRYAPTAAPEGMRKEIEALL